MLEQQNEHSIFITCHEMPRLPRNLHVVATSRSPGNAVRGKYATRRNTTRLRAAPATPNENAHVQARATKHATHLRTTPHEYAKVLRLPRRTTFHTSPNTSTCHEMTREPFRTVIYQKKTDTNPRHAILCEPARLKRTWIFHKNNFAWKF